MSVSPERRPAELRLLYAVGRLDRAIRNELQAGLEPLGISRPQYATLTMLRARSGLSSAQLARRASVTRASMTQVLAALVDRGLVDRAPSSDHRKILELTLTEDGHAVTAQCDVVADAIEARMLHEVPEGQRTDLLDLVRTCVRNLDAGFPDR
ncbi:MarR family transcriptional regulator [Nocardioides carbamazepini]|uniref:MarR family winged helix-turn-helix transcriptional regulator n=1 Tax=Nocardioides carbamazepini TaxID=2854259 RepID=UPI002149D608|nr:MarR family transcriptional regulator [Nocardioides carbamazepini]MCR1785821.1 MarR family transcriptional regulator [Nocardioides carbamazepini]